MTNEELVEAIQKGINVQANMQQLYEQNHGLIFQWIRPYTYYAEADDLMQEAFLGLHEAVQRYDPGQDVLFMTYAPYWIRQAVSRYCDNNGQAGLSKRVPVHMREAIRKYKRFCADYRQGHGGADPGDAAICDGMGVDQDKLNRIRKTVIEMHSISIDEPMAGTDGLTFGDSIPDDFDLEQAVTDQEADRADSALLWKQVRTLPERQQDIILKHFQDNVPLKDIASACGLSGERVRQLEAKGLKTLHDRAELKQMALDRDMDVDSVAYRGGIRRFRHTGTSATEAAAFRGLEKQDTLTRYMKLKADLAAMMTAQQADQERW